MAVKIKVCLLSETLSSGQWCTQEGASSVTAEGTGKAHGSVAGEFRKENQSLKSHSCKELPEGQAS